MALTKEDFLSKITEIGTMTDDVERRTHLTNLADEISGLYDSNDTLRKDNEKYKTDNETLRSANMQLFLRVGEKREGSNGRSQQQGDSNINNLKYEDLFNEKGELK